MNVGVPAHASLKVSHGIPKATAFLIQLHIRKGNELVFYAEESIPLLIGGRTFLIDFEEEWIPKEDGNYTITVVLSTPDKNLNYDIQNFSYKIATQEKTEDLVKDIIGGISNIINPEKPPITGIEEPVTDVNTNQQEPNPDNTTLYTATGLAIIIGIGIFVYLKIK